MEDNQVNDKALNELHKIKNIDQEIVRNNIFNKTDFKKKMKIL